MSAALSEYKIGKCRWCGDHGEMYRDAVYCDGCESDVVRCSVCRENVHVNNKCRHVFQDNNFVWRGAGTYPDDPDMRAPFWALLDAMPGGFAADLQGAIKSGKFYTWMVAPLIGGGGSLSLYGMPSWRRSDWGAALIELGGGDDAEKLADGYRWIVSLYKTSTPVANRITCKWIDEWFMQEPE